MKYEPEFTNYLISNDIIYLDSKLSFKSYSEHAVYKFILLSLIGRKNIININPEEKKMLNDFIWSAKKEGFKLLYSYRIYNFKNSAFSDFIKQLGSDNSDKIRKALKSKLLKYTGDTDFYILINIKYLFWIIEKSKLERVDLYCDKINFIHSRAQPE